MYSFNDELRVFLDCGNYFGDNTNLGDEAVLRGIAEGFDKHLPHAEIKIATFAGDVIRRACPRFAPKILTERDDRYSDDFRNLIVETDVVGVVFAGAFSDFFADHALGLLYTLELAAALDKPTIVLSAGFERVTDPRLVARAKEVFPKVTWIGCREGAEGPSLLREWGVPQSRIVITGDAALPGAHRNSRSQMGNNIGLSLRLSQYSGLDEDFPPKLEQPFLRLAEAYGAKLVPIPISLEGPSDLRVLERFCGSPLEFDSFSPTSLAAAISSCRVVVTGTYHAAVFALGQGIPVVALAESLHYRTKMGGLQAMFPRGLSHVRTGRRNGSAPHAAGRSPLDWRSNDSPPNAKSSPRTDRLPRAVLDSYGEVYIETLKTAQANPEYVGTRDLRPWRGLRDGRPLGLWGRGLPELNLIPIQVIDPGEATVGFIHSFGVNLYSLLF